MTISECYNCGEPITFNPEFFENDKESSKNIPKLLELDGKPHVCMLFEGKYKIKKLSEWKNRIKLAINLTNYKFQKGDKEKYYFDNFLRDTFNEEELKTRFVEYGIKLPAKVKIRVLLKQLGLELTGNKKPYIVLEGQAKKKIRLQKKLMI